ncbi:hypothetical protein GGX14DRAFT_580197 [Mycena pura]|uniref:Uncharacterized protein n=1 Tax=Mycena pura TaxID=153505 RepID=A0AAD6ULR3_9AGAR|nr:hypothetical protein GGX14DRAFT_580197 [Mycena pura]
MLLIGSLSLATGLAIQAGKPWITPLIAQPDVARAQVRAQATIYGISQYGPQDTDVIFEETASFSVAGVGPSSVTTYIEEVVETYEAFVDAISATTHTFVFPDSPQTVDWFFVESSGGFSESLSTISLPETVTDFSFDCATGADSKPTCTSSAFLDAISTQAPVVNVCQFNADEEGNCTDLLPFGDNTFSFSGSVVPIHTVAATASTATNTNQSGAVVHVVRIWWSSMFAVVVVLITLLL